MTMLVEVCRLQDGPAVAGDEYVRRHPGASHAHLSGWPRLVERSYGHQGFHVQAREGGAITGVLPLILIRGRLFGSSLVSLPFLDDGGIVADDPGTAKALYARAWQLSEAHGATVLELRHRRPVGLDIPVFGSKVTFELDLAASADEMWRRFDAKLRNQIRKALKLGLTTSWSGLESVAEFYEVFAANMRDLGSPVHSRRFFEEMLGEFPDSVRLVLVRRGSQVIGGGVCLAFRDTLAVPWAASLRAQRALCPNNLLYWEVIRWGCDKGYRRLDYGRSSPGSGTYRFKKQWGATAHPLHWQCAGRTGHGGSAIDSGSLKYRWASRLWKRLPVSVTKVIGPPLRRQLSH